MSNSNRSASSTPEEKKTPLNICIIDVPNATILRAVVHDLHAMNATFVLGALDKNGKMLSKMTDHPYVKLPLKERDTLMEKWRGKTIQSAASFRIVSFNPSHRLLTYANNLNFTLNLINGKLDTIVDAAMEVKENENAETE